MKLLTQILRVVRNMKTMSVYCRMKYLSFVLIVLLTSLSFGVNYYLSPVGNDVTGDGSIGNPYYSCKTPNSTMVAGDTCFFIEGEYTYSGASISISPQTTETIRPANSGNSENAIVYINYNGGDVLITGNMSTRYNSSAILLNGTCSYSGGWICSGANYIVIKGLNFKNFYQMIVSSSPTTSSGYTEISYCTFDSASPVYLSGTATSVSSGVLIDAVADFQNIDTARNDVPIGSNVYNVTEQTYATVSSISSATQLNLSSNIFTNPGDEYKIINYAYYNSSIRNSHHNWIHHDTIRNTGEVNSISTSHQGAGLDFGLDQSGTCEPSCINISNYNTIENNTIYNTGHHSLGMHNKYNVLRNNDLSNKKWYDTDFDNPDKGEWGYRVIQIQSYPTEGGSSLIEGNNIHHGSANDGFSQVGPLIQLGTPKNIVRYNNMYSGDAMALTIRPYIEEYYRCQPEHNRIYNNTFYNNGNGTSGDIAVTYRADVCYYFNSDWTIDGDVSWEIVEDNAFKNNLFYAGYNSTTLGIQAFYTAIFPVPLYPTEYIGQIFNNSDDFTTFVDPVFIDDDIDNPDLNLSSESPMIDSASYLTLTNGSGINKDTIIVDDARYFQDGTWGSDLARSTINADWISIGEVTNVYQIDTVDYDNNKLILTSTTTWDDDFPIRLYKNSSGNIVLYGNETDYGANEYYPTPVLDTIYNNVLRQADNWQAFRLYDSINIEGVNFGDSGTTSAIYINSTGSILADLVSWTPTKVRGIVPYGTPRGYYRARVRRNDGVITTNPTSNNMKVIIGSRL